MAELILSDGRKIPSTVRLTPADESGKMFHITGYADVFVRPLGNQGECWYLLNGSLVLANGPLFCYALGFCDMKLITETSHPEGIMGEYTLIDENTKSRTNFFDPVNNISYSNGNVWLE